MKMQLISDIMIHIWILYSYNYEYIYIEIIKSNERPFKISNDFLTDVF